MPKFFDEVTPLFGFDDRTTTTPFQMVPYMGSRTIMLLLSRMVDRLAWNDTSIGYSKEMGPNLRTLFGKKPGTATVTAYDKAGKELGKLEVCVKKKKTVKVAFNFVSDTGGHKTKRQKSSVDGWVEKINAILMNQANIEVVKHSARDVVVGKDLGKAVVAIDGVDLSEWTAVTSLADTSADVNIFFVWEWERDNDPRTDYEGLHFEGKIILEDKAGSQFGETIAHELSHFLGGGLLKDTLDTHKKRWLMYGITDDRGKFLPKDHILTMNKT